jgi:hypothetical protein
MQSKVLARASSALLALAAAQAGAPSRSRSRISRNTGPRRGRTVTHRRIPRPRGARIERQGNQPPDLQLAEGKTVKTLRFGQESHVHGRDLDPDDTITVARAKRYPGEESLRSTGQLMSTNVTRDKQRTLFAYLLDDGQQRRPQEGRRQRVPATTLDKEPGKILVNFYCWEYFCGEDGDTVVYKVDTITGERKEVERIKDGDSSSGLIFDHDGVARVAYARNKDGTPRISYRATQNLAVAAAGEVAGRLRDRQRCVAEDNNTLYAEVSDTGEATQLYKLDVAAGTRTKLLGRDDINVGTS